MKKKSKFQLEKLAKKAVKKALDDGHITKAEFDKHYSEKAKKIESKKKLDNKLKNKKPKIIYGLNTNSM